MLGQGLQWVTINAGGSSLQQVSKGGAEAGRPWESGARTWEDKDEAGGQASDDRDDLADVRDEECQQQREQEPDQRLQHSPPSLPPHVLLHGHPLVAQPQAFDHRPATWRNAQLRPCSQPPPPAYGARPLGCTPAHSPCLQL